MEPEHGAHQFFGQTDIAVVIDAALGDDKAGLAVANQYRADIAELTQGVQNASNGLTQLQIVDGGLNNVSQMLDRMKTLAWIAMWTARQCRLRCDVRRPPKVSSRTAIAPAVRIRTPGRWTSAVPHRI